jgi:hypothetical protein
MIGKFNLIRLVKRAKFSTLAKVGEGASNSSKPVVASADSAVTASKSGGSSFFQRFSSFLAGCGVGFGISGYYIFNELEESNRKFAKDIQQLQAQINKSK